MPSNNEKESRVNKQERQKKKLYKMERKGVKNESKKM